MHENESNGCDENENVEIYLCSVTGDIECTFSAFEMVLRLKFDEGSDQMHAFHIESAASLMSCLSIVAFFSTSLSLGVRSFLLLGF
eukprot:COSAG06_NODE_48355_length_332_cov_1.356223_1_plen_85_part_01